MKLSKYLVGTLACALMAACSNEENVQGENLLNEGGQAYMAINLVAPNTMSRTFEEGQGNESTIGRGRFYFFDASNNPVPVGANGVNYVERPIDFNGNDDGTPGTDKIESTHTILVLNGSSQTPAKMVAILNPPTKILGATSQNLTDLLGDKLAANYETDLQGEDKFVMSNSVYYSTTDSKVINTVDGIANHISTTPEAAQNDPVDIYVERVLAKVAVTQGEQSGTLNDQTASFDTTEDFDTDGSGTAQSAKVMAKIKGWTIADRSKISYLVKHINTDWVTTSPFENAAAWNAPEYFRSYWAEIPTTGNDVVNDKTYSQITDFSAKYCQERTGATPNTVLLVAAELLVNGTATTIAKYAGQLWTLDDLKTHICGQIQRSATPIYYSTDNGTNYSPLTKDQIKFRMRTTDEKEDVKAYESVVTLADAAESYTFAKKSSEVGENDKYANVNAVNEILNTYKALVWDQGKTYYYVPIEHSIGSSNTEKLYGVVRNHYYKINITGVEGLGTPIPPTEGGGSEEPIDPETPTDEYSYLAARINVLSWNVVAQDDVVLGNNK
ncbi:Mfa1 family fimbria major subunit [Phocaeicola salanitronis]|uniref:Mfa1 family fimbria major subunit n=1 Tax=Phocaeicola salanitronis TaxID=376805 RepID=UPI003209C569